MFVGYGVQAPEYQWDDFKGVDVKGKTIVVLVNDPPVPDPADPDAARSEDLRRQGDDLLRPLDLQVREGRRARRRRRVHRPRDRAGRLSASASCRASAASASIWSRRTRTWAARRSRAGCRSRPRRRCSKMAGQDYQALKAQAAHARLQAGAARHDGVDVVQAGDAHVDSQNVVAKITGSGSDAQERVRRLHRALGSLRHRHAGQRRQRSTTARATTRPARRCCSRSRARSRR